MEKRHGILIVFGSLSLKFNYDGSDLNREFMIAISVAVMMMEKM